MSSASVFVQAQVSAPGPIITAGPDMSGLTTITGVPSASGSYILSANLLSPSSGNITVMASAGLEISIDNINFSASPLNIPYTGGQLAGQPIYVRLSASAPIGAFSGTIINSGGSAASATVIVNGSVSNVPTINAGLSITGLTATSGSPSASVFYTLSAYSLLPAAGNITVTASADLELSTDNVNFFTSALIIPYTVGSLPGMHIYVRISSSAPQGTISGTVTNSGGGAADAIVTVNGAVGRVYYNTKANLGLTNPGTWSATMDGTGPSPLSMNDVDQLFYIVNASNIDYSGTWDVSALNSKIVIGDGMNPINFTILPGADSITSASKIQVLANATLTILNNRIPTFDTLEVGSTVDFAQTGTTSNDTIWIPLRDDYYNLKLTGGLKYFSENVPQAPGILTTKIKNDLIFDGVVSINGASKGLYSDVYCAGDVTFLNGAAFEPESTGVAGRFHLLLRSDHTQHINSNGTVMYFSRLNTGLTANIIVSPNSTLNLGSFRNNCGLVVYNTSTLTTTGGNINIIHQGISICTGMIISAGTSFNMQKDVPGWWVSNNLRFAPGSSINNFTMNVTAIVDTINIETDVDITGVLTLTRGFIKMSEGATLHLTSTGSLTGGSANSFVDGAVSKTGTSAFTFPVGNYTRRKYAPVNISNYTGTTDTYTVRYKIGQTNNSIDPATLSLYPDYHVSNIEYWQVTPATTGGTVNLNFYYNDDFSQVFLPDQLRMAHFDGTDWNDIGGTPGASNTTTSGNVLVTAVSEFSPFTFSGISGTVVPVKLTSFTARREDKIVQLNWTTEQEINSKTFVVERSTDQHKWTEIARLNASGNSSQKINYTAADFNPAKGVNYYRLKQIDLDGKFNYSEIRSVYFGNDVNVVLVPNPASDKVTVYLPDNSAMSTIQVFNANGQLMKTISSADESVQINLAGFSRGMYTIKVSGKNMYEVKKLLIE
ncbi:MAG: T9SS type A sorting domain-containing protein [Ferruginibacter sp.]